MVVRLRLARHGTRNNPFYHLVAIQNTKARDARPIEKLGEYDPVPRPVRQAPAAQPKRAEDRPGYNGEVIRSGIVAKPVLEKRMEWNEDRIKYWLNTGAQPTKSVFRLLYRVRFSYLPTNTRPASFPPKSSSSSRACTAQPQLRRPAHRLRRATLLPRRNNVMTMHDKAWHGLAAPKAHAAHAIMPRAGPMTAKIFV